VHGGRLSTAPPQSSRRTPRQYHWRTFCAVLLPAIAEFGKDGRKRHELGLVRQIAVEEDVLERQELRRTHETRQNMVAMRGLAK
jgi:hypothetical protein